METLVEDVDTNIRVSINTRDDLLEILKATGKYGDRMDDVVARLIKHWKENPPDRGG